MIKAVDNALQKIPAQFLKRDMERIQKTINQFRQGVSSLNLQTPIILLNLDMPNGDYGQVLDFERRLYQGIQPHREKNTFTLNTTWLPEEGFRLVARSLEPSFSLIQKNSEQKREAILAKIAERFYTPPPKVGIADSLPLEWQTVATVTLPKTVKAKSNSNSKKSKKLKAVPDLRPFTTTTPPPFEPNVVVPANKKRRLNNTIEASFHLKQVCYRT
jgi:hypothetical protein